ncbi:MAG: gliding motility-associated ABC transporter permease subunit GldF, partial [Ekhidna sp.]
IDTAGIIGSYIGLILLGGIFTSIGILASALTGNQIVSFILAAFLCFSFYAGFDSIASINIWSETSFIIEQIGILAHYETLSKGLIDMSDVVYFLSMIALFLYVTRIILNVQKG